LEAAFCHSCTMDRSEWIPHTTKTGKILYYINPVTGECKWQSQLNKEQYKQESTRILPSVPQVLLSQEAILTQQKHSLNTKCVVPTFKKEDKRSCSDLDSIEHGLTVGIPAECKTSNIDCLENGATCSHSGGSVSVNTDMEISVRSQESTVQQQQDHILQCPQCHEQFSCPSKLASHLRSHPEIDPLKCPVCSKEYSSSTSLTTHLRTHTGEKPFSCSHCHKSFNQSSHLTTHMRVHTGEKPYKCPQCPKTFGQSSHLTLHLRIHNGEKPFQCGFCAKGFSHSSALSTHMRTHTGEKPFQCPQCSKKFGQSSHLKIHVRTHTGERPYQCHRCHKCFRQSCYLTKHLRSHYSNDKINSDRNENDQNTVTL